MWLACYFTVLFNFGQIKGLITQTLYISLKYSVNNKWNCLFLGFAN